MTKQREIKFRAWDKKEEKMFEVWELKGIWSDPEPRDAMVVLWNDTGDEESNTKEIFLMDTILMQYTGLKDEDDKEIYEGDIIWQEIWNGGDGRTEPNETDRFEGIVIYDVNGFGIQTKGCENGETEVELVKNDEFNTSGVIGNIYENPELLK